jgi:hypothetical protein
LAVILVLNKALSILVLHILLSCHADI